MNERIRQLAEQATEPPVFPANIGYFDREKFAELIVQECIEQAHGVANLRGVNDDMIYGADTAAVRISKHFGVAK